MGSSDMTIGRNGRCLRLFVRLNNHLAAIALHLRSTPAEALDITARAWSIGDLLDAALATAPQGPVETAPDRRRKFKVIPGGKQ